MIAHEQEAVMYLIQCSSNSKLTNLKFMQDDLQETENTRSSKDPM